MPVINLNGIWNYGCDTVSYKWRPVPRLPPSEFFQLGLRTLRWRTPTLTTSGPSALSFPADAPHLLSLPRLSRTTPTANDNAWAG